TVPVSAKGRLVRIAYATVPPIIRHPASAPQAPPTRARRRRVETRAPDRSHAASRRPSRTPAVVPGRTPERSGRGSRAGCAPRSRASRAAPRASERTRTPARSVRPHRRAPTTTNTVGIPKAARGSLVPDALPRHRRTLPRLGFPLTVSAHPPYSPTLPRVRCRRSRDGRADESSMHVTLIRPPKITSDFAPHTQSGVPPIALACLAAVLEEAGHAVTVIDAYGEAPSRATDIPGTNLTTVGLTADEIAAAVPAETHVIGLTCMFSQDWLYAKR